ncbi:MAG: carbohydrate porin [Labilithrix sp.]|nr:carbohydrate porin [Labilithrix sp.]MCW5811225.1 carbohydrate porin [Labilithrix sp.]
MRPRILLAVALVLATPSLASAQGRAPKREAPAEPEVQEPKPAPASAPASDGPKPAPASDGPITSDTSAPSIPGATSSPALARGNQPVRGTLEEPPSSHEGGFVFGSYGRVWAASDLRGSTGRGTNIVAFGPRIVDEGSYGELELRREDTFNPRVKTRIVATLALFPPFFHFTGNPANSIGVRNLYAQGTYDKLTLWAGSRMYRGDDIYLLNWWPLDNQNTIGGGVGGPVYKSADGSQETILQGHVGQQRLDNPYQFQQVPVVAPFGFGTVDVTKLDRPRTIETGKVTHFVRPGGGPAGFKVVLYGELHQVAAGVLRDPLTQRDRGLPGDFGFLLGSQLTYFAGKRDTYASLVMRYARGIAAYDPLAAPITFELDRSVSGASETQVALSGNWENDLVAFTGAAYVRFFRDAGPAETSTQKYDEGVVVLRPSVFLGDYFGISVEGSYQARRIAIQDPNGDGPLTASVLKAGIIPYFSPSGKGTFKRPQIRLLYNASLRSAGARALYAIEDPFSQRSVEHFIGLGAEWWFNSSSYP